MSASIQMLLDQLQAGDDSAREDLLEHCVERFRLLARRMLRQQNHLRRLDDTDDVLQKALVRLHKALALKPPTVRAFFALASQHIRWVLQDVARQLARAGVVSPLEAENVHDRCGEPADLLEWTEFHEKISSLPEGEREVFDLLFYQGMQQEEAAEVLNVSVRTIKRRWQRARLLLHGRLRGEWPAL